MQPANNGQPAAKGPKLRSVHATEQVAHLWANGIERSIRNAQETASTSENGRVLYSYAQSIAARTDVVDAEGRRVYLFNANARESVTTQKHMRSANHAVPFHVCYTSAASTPAAWDGRRDTIPAATCLYFVNGADKVPPSSQILTFCVPDVNADGPIAAAVNYKRMFAAAEADARVMAKRRSKFYPAHVAAAFRAAAEYRALFCAEYCADLADGFDWTALAAQFSKVIARQEKAAAAEAARHAGYRQAERAWMTAVAPTLTDLAAVMRAAPVGGANSLRDAVIAFEASGIWDLATPNLTSHSPTRAIIAHLIRNGGTDFHDVATRLGFKVLPAFSLPVDGAIRPPCAASVGSYPKPPTRIVFGRERAESYSDVRQVYEAVGLERYEHTHGHRTARGAVGRDLLFVRQGGDEVITSGGARAPIGIIAALWRRHGAEICAAAVNPVDVTFPEARRVGAFTWVGYDLGNSGGRETDGGESVLVIGCHLVAAADVARLARRLGWPQADESA